MAVSEAEEEEEDDDDDVVEEEGKKEKGEAEKSAPVTPVAPRGKKPG